MARGYARRGLARHADGALVIYDVLACGRRSKGSRDCLDGCYRFLRVVFDGEFPETSDDDIQLCCTGGRREQEFALEALV